MLLKMNNNKRFLIYGSIAVLILVIAAIVLFIKLSAPKGKINIEPNTERISIFYGVPSDAIIILDFKSLSHFAPMLNDTASFATKLLEDKNPLLLFYQKLASFKELANLPFVYSLHYSAKNSVSFLQAINLSNLGDANKLFEKINDEQGATKRKYNNTYIYTYPNGLNVSLHNNFILASNSSYVLESSVRHLENGTSIVDNIEFKNILLKNESKENIYINHKQIGKLFSGEIERRFLGFSDFFLQLSSWSVLEIIQNKGELKLKGCFSNNSDEANYSTIYYNMLNGKSLMGDILPANTVFAFTMPTVSSKYIASFKLFLEVRKQLGKYNYNQQVVKLKNGPSPIDWFSSFKAEEIVSAYCKFGEKCEWLTLIREKSSVGISSIISKISKHKNKVMPFKYKGYVASVFGGMFAQCNEEAYCKIGDWTIIGPTKIIEEFNNGNANYYSFDNYIQQTPASAFLGQESANKIAINLKEGGDSVLQIFKPYMRGLLSSSFKKNNFEYATVNIFPDDSSNVEIDISLYATRLKEVPKPRVRSNDDGSVKFEVDSTINLPMGPFEVKDIDKNTKAYLEQLPSKWLGYSDENKKALWGIPFKTLICGAVGQVDFFKNGKLQMVFISEDKLYLLDKLARFVQGYPVTLPKKVVYGPSVMDLNRDKNYTIMVLNEDNTISWCGIDGKRVKGWKDIKVPEFVKELPKFKIIGGKNYWVLKAPSQLRLYTINGKEIIIADKKRKIDRESGIKFVTGDEIRVKGVDGKDFILNLVTGKTKKAK